MRFRRRPRPRSYESPKLSRACWVMGGIWERGISCPVCNNKAGKIEDKNIKKEKGRVNIHAPMVLCASRTTINASLSAKKGQAVDWLEMEDLVGS